MEAPLEAVEAVASMAVAAERLVLRELCQLAFALSSVAVFPSGSKEYCIKKSPSIRFS